MASIFSTSTSDASDSFFEDLKLNVIESEKEKLEQTKANIAQKEQGGFVQASSPMVSKTTYIIMGVAFVGLIAVAIMKKKGVF